MWGGDGPRLDPAEKKKMQKALDQAKQLSKRFDEMKARFDDLQSKYDQMAEKCSRSVWQLRQDHGEVLRLKREKVLFQQLKLKLTVNESTNFVCLKNQYSSSDSV